MITVASAKTNNVKETNLLSVRERKISMIQNNKLSKSINTLQKDLSKKQDKV